MIICIGANYLSFIYTFYSYTPFIILCSYLAHEQEMSSTTSSKQQALLLESRRWANKYTSINWQLFVVTIENVFAASCYSGVTEFASRPTTKLCVVIFSVCIGLVNLNLTKEGF